MQSGNEQGAQRPSFSGISDAFGSLGAVGRRAGAARGQAMLIVLVLVWIGMDILTAGLFISPRNLSALAVQGAIKSVLAVGMAMLLIGGEIDLSIGATVAFAGIVAAECQVNGLGAVETILAALLAGLALGIAQGLLVAYAKIPSFIVTLAGMLVWRGLGFLITKSESIGPVRPPFSGLTESYLPPVPSLVVLGILAAGVLIWTARTRAYPVGMAAMAGLVLVGWVAASYRGLPTAVIVMACCVVAGVFLLRQTVFGRRLYVVGGNPEAALYAGISRRQLRLGLFLIMGLTYGLAGAMTTARLGGAPPNVGLGLELDVISACIIGGVSLFGGRGTVQGAIVGVFLFESLTNGMALLNLNINLQLVVRGLVLVAAVWFDVLSQRKGTMRS